MIVRAMNVLGVSMIIEWSCFSPSLSISVQNLLYILKYYDLLYELTAKFLEELWITTLFIGNIYVLLILSSFVPISWKRRLKMEGKGKDLLKRCKAACLCSILTFWDQYGIWEEQTNFQLLPCLKVDPLVFPFSLIICRTFKQSSVVGWVFIQRIQQMSHLFFFFPFPKDKRFHIWWSHKMLKSGVQRKGPSPKHKTSKLRSPSTLPSQPPMKCHPRKKLINTVLYVCLHY